MEELAAAQALVGQIPEGKKEGVFWGASFITAFASAALPINPVIIPIQISILVVLILVLIFVFGVNWKWAFIYGYVGMVGLITVAGTFFGKFLLSAVF